MAPRTLPPGEYQGIIKEEIRTGDFVSPLNAGAIATVSITLQQALDRYYGKEVASQSSKLLENVKPSEPPIVWSVLGIHSTGNSTPVWATVDCRNGNSAPEVVLLENLKLVHRPKFKVGDRVSILNASSINELNDGSTGIVTSVRLQTYTVMFDILDFSLLIREGNLELIDTLSSPPIEEPPMGEREPSSFRLSFYAALKGRNRPSANMFQLTASKLANKVGKVSWQLNEDGLFGPGTEKVAKDIQKHYGLSPVDGIVGKGTWRALTPDLGVWRPPLRLRIAECQCTWEAGDDGYGYYGLIGWEGWWNYGIWNVNRGSARSLVYMGSAFNLIATINQADEEGNTSEGRDLAAKVASWFKYEGKDIQIGEYFIEKTLKPSIRNLILLGWDPQKLGLSKPDEIDSIATIEEADELLGKVDPFHERLILQACDITVNSGPGNYFPNKSPRAWGGHGDEAWPEDKLPPKEEVKRVFGEVFGQEIPNDYTYLTADHPDDTYRDALKRSLDELCSTDEQRINLIGELQARCVIGKWRGDVIRRRRAVAWKEGHAFQGSFYCMGEHFGIGL
jgi:peptidoglycan hydrolase-like protein with peptidoglycan-binding domain